MTIRHLVFSFYLLFMSVICFANSDPSVVFSEDEVSGPLPDVQKHCEMLEKINDFQEFACTFANDPEPFINERDCEIISIYPLIYSCSDSKQTCGVIIYNPFSPYPDVEFFCLTWNPKPVD